MTVPALAHAFDVSISSRAICNGPSSPHLAQPFHRLHRLHIFWKVWNGANDTEGRKTKGPSAWLVSVPHNARNAARSTFRVVAWSRLPSDPSSDDAVAVNCFEKILSCILQHTHIHTKGLHLPKRATLKETVKR